MNCPKARRLVDAYVDDELDVATVVDLEEHVEACPECAWAYESRRAVRAALRQTDARGGVPGALDARVRSAVREAAGVREAGPRRASAAALLRPRAWVAAAALAVVVLSAGLAWRVAAERPGDAIARDAVASHVRSLMADHITDVPSSDQHTVKPWFDGRIDFAPPVVDLADHGFALVGGRLDYVGDAPAAALVYERRRHVVNLFVRPSDGPAPVRADAYKGYNVVRWASGAMAFCAVSDLNAEELREFAEAIRSRTDAPTAP